MLAQELNILGKLSSLWCTFLETIQVFTKRRYGLDELSLYVFTISQRQSHFLELNIHWMTNKKFSMSKKIKRANCCFNWEQRLKFRSLTLKKRKIFHGRIFYHSWLHAHLSKQCISVFVIKLDLFFTAWWGCHIWLIFVTPDQSESWIKVTWLVLTNEKLIFVSPRSTFVSSLNVDTDQDQSSRSRFR